MSTKTHLQNYLKVILGNHVEADIVDYINSMKHPEDLEEFMDNILDKNNISHITSYEGIYKILFGNRAGSKSNNEAPKVLKSNDKTNSNKTSKFPKGKKKFSDIGSFEEKKKQKEGRTVCDCEGQEHEFMNNCLNCGRIHCFEEGPGPCFFCNEPVTVMGEEMFFDGKGKSKKSTVAKHRENVVFDDDNDYFKATTKTQSKEDKRKLVVALDFASRKVIESTAEDVKIKEKLHDDIKKHLTNVEKLYRKLQKESEIQTAASDNNDLVDLLVQMRHKKPAGVEDLGAEDNTTHFVDYGKVYDEEVIANSDLGLCLSMHQPYASLLVAGVKKHEGRTWKTNHRGRLWIAAAAKVTDDDDISALETFYRQYYNDQTLKFPREYPTSCLLGCVFVEDCLDQETYRKRFPNGESSSPYVLICSNPIILPIFYPVVGQHKIYALDKELHNCAKLSIRHATYGID